MRYVELEKNLLECNFIDILPAGKKITGLVAHHPAAVRVEDYQLELRQRINGRTVVTPAGSVIFDRQGILRRRTVITGVSLDEEYFLASIFASRSELGEGFVKDVISGLYIRAEEDAGLRSIGKRSLIERFSQLLSHSWS